MTSNNNEGYETARGMDYISLVPIGIRVERFSSETLFPTCMKSSPFSLELTSGTGLNDSDVTLRGEPGTARYFLDNIWLTGESRIILTISYYLLNG